MLTAGAALIQHTCLWFPSLVTPFSILSDLALDTLHGLLRHRDGVFKPSANAITGLRTHSGVVVI
jgi:hypothetical protein